MARSARTNATNALPAPAKRSWLPPLRPFTAIRGVSGSGLTRDILAGVTLAALMIPLNIGYAQVAGLPASVGLYSAIVPMFIFPLLATSRHMVASPDAPVAALIGTLLATELALDPNTNVVQLALAQAIVAGGIFFLFWFFRLGFLANFLSRAVLIGFISGLGIEVLISQIKKIMGVSIEAEGFFAEIWQIFVSIPSSNWYAVALGVGTIIVVRLLKRFAPQVPGALIALILFTIVVAAFNLSAQGVSVLGAENVPSGLPRLTFPQLAIGDWLALIPGAIALCAVTMAEGLLIARNYAQKHGEKIDPDQELFAFGATNLASGVTGGFFIGSSASRTAAMDSQGTRTQIPTLVAGVVVALAVLFLSGFLAVLPNPVLAGIVANAVLKLIEIGELKELYRQRKDEFWIAMVALATVLLVGALFAVIVAFLLSTILVVARAAYPKTSVLAPAEDGDLYIGRGDSLTAGEEDFLVYRFGGALYFANANVFAEQTRALVTGAHKPQWFVLDAEAIEDIDTTGADALRSLLDTLENQGTTFAITRATAPVPELLHTYELMERIGEEHIFRTNRDAEKAWRASHPVTA